MHTKYLLPSLWVVALGFASTAAPNRLPATEPLPESEKYLGKAPPGEKPEFFPLPVRKGFFAGQRVAISADGSEFYYTELTPNYDEYNVLCLRYVNGKWIGPFPVFKKLGAPALSPDGSTLFLEEPAEGSTSWTSTRTETGWTTPARNTLLASPKDLHNLQLIDDGTYFATVENSKDGLGEKDIAKLVTIGSKPVMQSLGAPLNTARHENDLFVSRDGSYVIFSSPDLGGAGCGDLFISFHQADNTWTKPRNLGWPINSEGFDFAPYVTIDGKYLFFTRSPGPANIFVCWCRFDRVLAKFRANAGLPPIAVVAPE